MLSFLDCKFRNKERKGEPSENSESDHIHMVAQAQPVKHNPTLFMKDMIVIDQERPSIISLLLLIQTLHVAWVWQMLWLYLLQIMCSFCVKPVVLCTFTCTILTKTQTAKTVMCHLEEIWTISVLFAHLDRHKVWAEKGNTAMDYSTYTISAPFCNAQNAIRVAVNCSQLLLHSGKSTTSFIHSIMHTS